MGLGKGALGYWPELKFLMSQLILEENKTQISVKRMMQQQKHFQLAVVPTFQLNMFAASKKTKKIAAQRALSPCKS